MKCDENLALDIIKLSKKFASMHKDYVGIYNTFDDYVSELSTLVVKNIDSYDPEKGKFSTWCYKVFSQKTLKDLMKSMKKNENQYLNSLDQPINEDGDVLMDVIPEDRNYQEDIEENLYAKDIYKKLYPYLSFELKSYVIDNKTIPQIAKEMNISKQGLYNKIEKEIQNIRLALEQDNLNLLRKTRKVAIDYCKEHNCSLRTYYRRKSKGENYETECESELYY